MGKETVKERLSDNPTPTNPEDAQRVKNGAVSFWYSDIGGLPTRRKSLNESLHADVCIVGAGFTGLWTAYYLATQSRLKVVVLEREFAGFGASGRNGGNMTGGGWPRHAYLKRSTDKQITAFEELLRHTPQEIMRVAAIEGINADFANGGNLQVATTPAQRRRQEQNFSLLKKRYGENASLKLLSREELHDRVRIPSALGALWQSFPTRIQPAKLVRGLAEAVERHGVRIFENTEVRTVEPRKVTTTDGFQVTADRIVRATEGFTPELKGAHRELIPLNSAMIVTEPLPDDLMSAIGWEGRETVSETSYLYSYCQRTRENRITLGGRGVPYRFGSEVDKNGETQIKTIAMLLSDLRRLFPQLSPIKVEHAWCGPLGTPRDWCARVNYDRSTGYGWAGGYVGGGISPSNLAGRTMADLILDRRSDLTEQPWVNLPIRRWEVEPVRWLGIHAMYKLYAIADRKERRGDANSSWLAKIANKITGRE